MTAEITPAQLFGIPLPSMPLRADPERFTRYTGEVIHPLISAFVPFGRRLVIMREEALKMYGGVIHIPDQAVEVPARGWVIAVGNSVSSPFDPGAPVLGIMPLSPFQLLGCKVLFGMYAGQALLTGDKGEDNYTSRYLLIDEGSIWGIVGSPPPEPLTRVPTAPQLSNEETPNA